MNNIFLLIVEFIFVMTLLLAGFVMLESMCALIKGLGSCFIY